MKKIVLIVGICFLSNSLFSKNIIDWKRSDGGRKGYRNVNQTYEGTVDSGASRYTVTCKDPGLETCRFVPGALPSGGSLDDIALYYGTPFLNGMADDAEFRIEDDQIESGNSTKTIQVTLDGVSYNIYLEMSWHILSDGTYSMTGTSEAVVI